MLHGHKKRIVACIFLNCCLKNKCFEAAEMQSAAKENACCYICTLSERLFLSSVREASAHEDGAQRARDY